MATLLVTRKMNPALRARVEASVSPGRPLRRGRFGPAWVAAARWAASLAAVLLVVWGVRHTRRTMGEKARARAAIDRARAELLDATRSAAARSAAADGTYLARVSAWLARAAGPYEGDIVSPELRVTGALTARLRAPIVTVRGPLAAWATPNGIAQAAASSWTDAFALCLVQPPTARTEKAMLATVRTAYGGSADPHAEHAATLLRLGDAFAALPLFSPERVSHIEAARSLGEIAKLRADLDGPQLARAEQVARARLLLAVVDEPDEPGKPTELDGEHAHMARVVLVDVAASQVLLRAREHLDPSWISDALRPRYARGLDACALALAIRARAP